MLTLIACQAVGVSAFQRSALDVGDTRESRSSLEPGERIERDIGAGETHRYVFKIEADKLATLTFKDNGGVGARLYVSDGQRVCCGNFPGLRDRLPFFAVMEVPILSTSAEEYRLEVECSSKSKTQRYQLTLSESRAPTDRDLKHITAWRKTGEAMSLHSQRRKESYERAIELCKEAATLWREIDDPAYESFALYYAGESCWEVSRYDEAVDLFNKALAANRAAGGSPLQGEIFVSRGQAYQNLSEYRKALASYQDALDISPERPDKLIEAWTLDNIGVAYNSLGEKKLALDYHFQSSALYQSYKDGQGDARGIAHSFTRIGEVYASIGEKQKALEYLERALPYWTSIPDKWGEARVYHRLADVYYSMGEMETALDYYKQALKGSQEAGDHLAESNALSTIGKIYASTSDSAAALEYANRALTLRRSAMNREGEAASLTQIGTISHSIGDNQRAVDYYNQALRIWREIDNPAGEGSTLSYLGDAYYSTGAIGEAMSYYNRALELRRQVQDREGEASTLYSIARAARDRGHLSQASAAIKQAIVIAEAIRTSVASDELRASYLAKVRDYYELYIDVLMREESVNRSGDRSSEALHVSERARARVLLELLASAGANIREGVDPALLELERRLRQKLDDKASYRTSLLIRKHSNEEAAALDAEIRAIASEYQRVESQIRVTSPRYATLTQPEPLTASEIQKLLDSNTLLLEYALGDKNSYLWVVGDHSIAAHQLPSRAEIEKAARGVYEMLTERNRRSKDETAAQRRARVAGADHEYVEAASVLSRMVLGPAAYELGNKRLLIVADGALQYIPFSALPVPSERRLGDRRRGLVSVVAHAASSRNKWPTTATKDPPTARNRAPSPNPQPLIVRHEMISLPSASSLAVLRREIENRMPAPKTLALLADAVFSPTDARVQAPPSKQNGSDSPKASGEVATVASRDLQRALLDVGEEQSMDGLPRLLGTRWEAEQIAPLVAESERMIALDFAANRETAMSTELSNYRIVHFASHALIDSTHPELSGVVLSLVDREGRPQDGFLRSNEIINLKLPADLVVLNACRTGLGKEVRGEGLIGLTRGFMYAGAARVLVSLWSLEDHSASELMKRMYEKMLGPKHLSPASALRDAQIEMWKEAGSHSPYFWAGYSLQGEWR